MIRHSAVTRGPDNRVGQKPQRQNRHWIRIRARSIPLRQSRIDTKFSTHENGKSKEPEMIRLLSSLRYECYKVSSDELLPANAFRVPKIFDHNLCEIFKTIVSVRSSNGSPKAHAAGRIFYQEKILCQLETQIVKPISVKSIQPPRCNSGFVAKREFTSRKTSRVRRGPQRETQQKNYQRRDRP